MELRDRFLLRLQEVLRVKNFSILAKQQIKDVLNRVYELDIENKEQHLFSIIDGLDDIDTFKFNTRKQLLKINCIREKMALDTLGFVNSSKHLAVVVKGVHEVGTTYHELVHISQNKNSYLLDEKYGFCELVQQALCEGESVYYESMLLKEEFPKTMSNNRITLFSYQPAIYKIFCEFYLDMRNLLGVSLIEKWKKNDSDTDIMLEIEQHVKDKYGFSFVPFYNVWKGLLYYFCIEDENMNELAQYSLKHQDKDYNYNKERYQILASREADYTNNIENVTAELNDINNAFEDEVILKSGFEERLNQVRIEYNEYVAENGDDDFAKEWAEEFETVTIEDYKDALIKEKTELEERKTRYKDSLTMVLEEKKQLDWFKSFHIPITDFNLKYLSALKEQMILGYKKSSNELSQATFYSNALFYSYIDREQLEKDDEFNFKHR